MFSRLVESFRHSVSCARWSVLPAPVWFLIASPLLGWALSGRFLFMWPAGAARSPLSRSFWRVGAVRRD